MLTRSAPLSPASNFSLCSRRLNWCSVSPNRRATQRGGLPGLLHTVSAISATNAPRVQCHSRLTNYTTRPIVVSVRRRGSFVNSMPEAPMALRRSVPDRVRQGGRHLACSTRRLPAAFRSQRRATAGSSRGARRGRFHGSRKLPRVFSQVFPGPFHSPQATPLLCFSFCIYVG